MFDSWVVVASSRSYPSRSLTCSEILWCQDLGVVIGMTVSSVLELWMVVQMSDFGVVVVVGFVLSSLELELRQRRAWEELFDSFAGDYRTLFLASCPFLFSALTQSDLKALERSCGVKEASTAGFSRSLVAQPSWWMSIRLFQAVEKSTFGHQIGLAWNLQVNESFTISMKKLARSFVFPCVELEICSESCFGLILCYSGLLLYPP